METSKQQQPIEPVNTTELFEKNLTDFMKAVWWDLKENRYKGLLVKNSSRIAKRDIRNFLKKETSDFNPDELDDAKKYIEDWEKRICVEYGLELPSITIQMKQLITEIIERQTPIVPTIPNIDERPERLGQPIIQELDAKLGSLVLENYYFWTNENDGIRNKQNIFTNTNPSAFLQMVQAADFSKIHINEKTQRVRYNISVLARKLGKEWGERAATSVGATLAECQRRTDFMRSEKWESLKKMFKS